MAKLGRAGTAWGRGASLGWGAGSTFGTGEVKAGCEGGVVGCGSG